jgi:hypothetical protein
MALPPTHELGWFRFVGPLVLVLAGLFLIRPFATASAAEPLTEKQKIEALIEHVGGLKDATFVRNGKEYDAKTASVFLQRKWEAQEDKVKTAHDFIEKIASASSTSGKPYLIRFKDGKEVKSGDYLQEELKKLEEPTTSPSRAEEPAEPRDVSRERPLELRIGVETLRNPFWYADQGFDAEARAFWDRSAWDRVLRAWAAEEYNAIVYWIEPWNKHAWQTFLVRHQEFPEARDLTPEQYDRVMEQVGWIFRRAHELGLKNFLFMYSIVTTPAFCKAHDLENLPVSASVDFRHTLKEMGPHFGVRNEQTRAFTEAAVAELFQVYPDLDGLYGAMGEAVPGKRSTWYREAIVPGMNRSGRKPVFLVASRHGAPRGVRQHVAFRAQQRGDVHRRTAVSGLCPLAG